MNILWMGKSKEYDVRNVSMVWYDKRILYYTIKGENGVLSAPLKSLAAVWSDETYAAHRHDDAVMIKVRG